MSVTRLALTSTPERSSRLTVEWEEWNLEPVVLPCIAVAPAEESVLESARLQAARSDWLVITSSRTVTTLWPAGGMPGTQVAAVGPATAEAVRRAGGVPSVIGDGGARRLVERIRDLGRGRSVFFPHAGGADPSTIAHLESAGAKVEARRVYEVRPIPPGADAVDAVVFGSPTAVTGWCLSRDLEGLAIGAIGDTTADVLVDRGAPADVRPIRPSFDLLIRSMAEHLRDRSTV